MWLYNICIYIYKCLILIASAFNKKAALLYNGSRAAINQIATMRADNAEYIWIHAASLGEFEQGRPIIERLRAERSDLKIALTFFSPSGYEVRKNFAGVDAVTYLPLDTPCAARQFVDVLRPSVAIFIKYEFWLNYLNILHERSIPTYSISAIFRPSQVFFRPYGTLFRNALQTFNTIFVQNEESSTLLRKAGFDRAIRAGDTRFDRVASIARSAARNDIVDRFVDGKAKVVVAGSTWESDEAMLLPFIKSHPDVKFILAPHNIDEARINSLASAVNAARYTQATPDGAQSECQVMIIDTYGLLSSLYRYATVAYVGGGFGVAVHNTPEAAVWGVPIVCGPHYHKFKEICDMIEAGAIVACHTHEECRIALEKLLENPDKAGAAAQSYVQGQLGATDLIIKHLNL